MAKGFCCTSWKMCSEKEGRKVKAGKKQISLMVRTMQENWSGFQFGD